MSESHAIISFYKSSCMGRSHIDSLVYCLRLLSHCKGRQVAVMETMEPEELKIFTIWLFPEKSLFTFVIDDVKPHFGTIKARKKNKTLNIPYPEIDLF